MSGTYSQGVGRDAQTCLLPMRSRFGNKMGTNPSRYCSSIPHMHWVEAREGSHCRLNWYIVEMTRGWGDQEAWSPSRLPDWLVLRLWGVTSSFWVSVHSLVNWRCWVRAVVLTWKVVTEGWAISLTEEDGGGMCK